MLTKHLASASLNTHRLYWKSNNTSPNKLAKYSLLHELHGLSLYFRLPSIVLIQSTPLFQINPNDRTSFVLGNSPKILFPLSQNIKSAAFYLFLMPSLRFQSCSLLLLSVYYNFLTDCLIHPTDSLLSWKRLLRDRLY